MPCLLNSYFLSPTDDSVVPVVNSASFTAPTGGDQAKVNITYTYTGADDLEIYAATGTDPVTVTRAQLLAGSGGTNTIEFVDGTLGSSPGTLSLSSGLTAASEAADRIVFFLREANNGGQGALQEVTASSLDYTAPTISSSDPADESTDHPVADNIVITFNENIVFGTGNIVLRLDSGGFGDAETFDVTSDVGTGAGQVSISGNVLTINPTSDLSNSADYAIRIASTAIENVAGIAFAGIADDTTLNFTTVAGGGSAFSEDWSGFATDELVDGTYTTVLSSAGAGELQVNDSGKVALNDDTSDQQVLEFYDPATTDYTANMVVDFNGGASANEEFIMEMNDDGAGTNFTVQFLGDGSVFRRTPGFAVVGSFTPSTNQKLTCTVSASGTTLQVFVDDVQVGSDATGLTATGGTAFGAGIRLSTAGTPDIDNPDIAIVSLEVE